MRKILAVSAFLMVMFGVFTSCLEGDQVTLTSNVYLSSFSINDIETEVPSKTAEGRDTIIVKKISGDSYLFAIDHLNGEVYNVDSLPKGTDVSQVTVNLGFVGAYAFYYPDGVTAKSYSSSDSIDFSSPVRFELHATDEESTKNYNIRLNVHKADMDSLVWVQVENHNFHGNRMTAEKMVQLRDYLMVFGEMDGLPTVMAGQLNGSFHFTKKEWHLQGITGTVDYSSVVAHENAVYLLADGKLYSSITGVEWMAESPERTFTSMVGVVDGKLCLNEGGTIVACDPYEWIPGTPVVNMIGDWSVVQTVDENSFPASPWVLEELLPTNSSIKRTTLVGAPRNYTGTYAAVWTKLSNEQKWTDYGTIQGNTQACPLLERLTVIPFDGKYYAFGGADKSGKLKPFEAFFISTDGGITWWKQTKKIGFPEELKGYDEAFACVVDTDKRIWLLCSDGRMFCGHMNRLAN